MWGCVFSVYPFLLWWLREYIYTLSYYHHQIGSMNYYPLFRVRSWNNGVRCMSFCILMIYIYSCFIAWFSKCTIGFVQFMWRSAGCKVPKYVYAQCFVKLCLAPHKPTTSFFPHITHLWLHWLLMCCSTSVGKGVYFRNTFSMYYQP